MKNVPEIVSAIRKRDKHAEAGHQGGVNSCPLCNRTESTAKSVFEDILEESKAEPEQKTDPFVSRLDKLLGNK